MSERQHPKRPFLLKERLNGRRYYLPEKKRRNTGYLETWNTEGGEEEPLGGPGLAGCDIQNWQCMMRYILHVLLAYFATKTGTLHN